MIAAPDPNNSGCDCTGSFEWREESSVPGAANFVGSTTGSQVTLRVVKSGEIYVTAVQGNCAGGLSTTALKVKITEIKGLYKANGNYQVGYTSTDNKGRIYSNRIYDATNPSKTIWTKDRQYIDITVQVEGDNDLPADAKIVWEAIDVDDPSNVDPMTEAAGRILDPNDYDGEGNFTEAQGDDNTGSRDGHSEWEEIHEDYALSGNKTAIKDGISKVRFNATDDAGDNWKIKASIQASPDDEPCDEGGAETGIVTTWHMIELENTRMGSAAELPLASLNQRFAPAFLQWQIDETSVINDLDPMGANELEALQNLFAHCHPPFFSHDPESGWYFVASCIRHLSAPAPVPLVDGTVHFNEALGGNARVSGGPSPNNPSFPGEHGGRMTFIEPIPEAEIKYVEVFNPQDITESIFFEAKVDETPIPGMPDRTRVDLRARKVQPVNNLNLWTLKTLPDHGPDFYELGPWLKVKVWGSSGLSLAGLTPWVGPVGNQQCTGRCLVYSQRSSGQPFTSEEIEETLVHELTHALGMAHKCGNRDYTISGKSCVMMYFDDWIVQENGLLQPWSGGNTGPELCAEHLEFIRKTNFEDDEDDAPGRILQWN